MLKPKSSIFLLGLRALLHQKHLYRQPVATPWGFKYNGPVAMILSDFEPDETKLMNAILDRSDVLVNVGANVATFVK